MSVEQLLQRWKKDPTFAENIIAWHTLPARQARFTPLPSDLPAALIAALHTRGVTALYTHQFQALQAARAGQHPVVVTGTASGKTYCFNLPVIERLLNQPQARAIYLYPTKALSQDQYDELQGLLGSFPLHSEPPLAPGVYDGDTSASHRQTIRKNARLIITNPDMLHMGILPHHTQWVEFFRGLQFVVIDEMHTYRGVFGSHVANVIRRLKRVARFYGAFPQFILTSATIANPSELAQRLIEEQVTLIDEDGAWRGEKHFLIYNPPIINKELSIRRSLLQESVRITDDLFSANVQTVVFGRARRSIELALAYLRQQVSNNSVQKSTEIIRGYRSGYLPGQRREIEQGLRQGTIRIVVATNALELGIDIGNLEAAVLAGYPGTIASTWQQAGRAGRSDRPALAVLITSANPLDQYLARFPDYFFSRTPEQALINPDNLLILLGHLRCAAFELPFQLGESYGNVPLDELNDLLLYLQQQGILHQSGSRYFWMSDSYPAQSISLRSASPEAILLHTEQNGQGQVVGQVDIPSAAWMVHPGAVYLHEGQEYLVESLDFEHHSALLKPFSGDYFTDPRRETTVKVIEKHAEQAVMGVVKAYGDVLVTTQVVGFKKIRWYTNEPLGMEPLTLPPHELATTGYWIAITPETIQALEAQNLWNSSPNNYGPTWTKLREQARMRDGYRCQMCGLPETSRSHDVHHKVPFRAFSSPVEANQLSNLVTLCPPCHRKAESAVRVRTGLAGLAYVLGNLAPLFLMCDARDLGVHADPQADFAQLQGKPCPAMVLYDQIPAGIGFSERLYEIHSELVTNARQLVSTCTCEDGCPSCVGPGGELGAGGRTETLALLDQLISDGPTGLFEAPFDQTPN